MHEGLIGIKTLRCALFGAGVMGRNHARVLSEIEELELTLVCDPVEPTWKVPEKAVAVSTVGQALNHDFDCAIVAVPTRFHVEVAKALAEASIPTLIEKPLAMTVNAGQEILRAFSETSTFAAVGHIERFNPAMMELRKRLDGSELGEVFQIATRRQSSFPGRISDVGVAKDLASHDIDLVRNISGSDYETIWARTSRRSGESHEELFAATGQLENGVIVNHVVNWLSPLKERVVVVTGEAGIFVANTATGDLTLHKNGQFPVDWGSLPSFRGVSEGDSIRFAFPKKEPLKSELIAFAEAVGNGVSGDLASLKDGLRVIEIIDMALSETP